MTEMGAAKIMIGHKLKRLRKELGLSQALMAEELGISGLISTCLKIICAL